MANIASLRILDNHIYNVCSYFDSSNSTFETCLGFGATTDSIPALITADSGTNYISFRFAPHDNTTHDQTLIFTNAPDGNAPYLLVARPPFSGLHEDPAEVYLNTIAPDSQWQWSLTSQKSGSNASSFSEFSDEYFWTIQTSDTKKYLAINDTNIETLQIQTETSYWLLVDMGSDDDNTPVPTVSSDTSAVPSISDGSSTPPASSTAGVTFSLGLPTDANGAYISSSSAGPLSSDELAGIAVGMTIAVLAIVVGVVLLLRRPRRRARIAASESTRSELLGGEIHEAPSTGKTRSELLRGEIYEAPAHARRPVEMGGDAPPVELPGHPYSQSLEIGDAKSNDTKSSDTRFEDTKVEYAKFEDGRYKA